MSLVAASLKNSLACEKKNNCKLFLTAERRKNKIKVVFSAQVSSSFTRREKGLFLYTKNLTI